jgi:riboflavin kinase/FMN adenylyltransferase
MEFIRGLLNLKPEHRGCVATIGNFDGVHTGHQAVLKQVIDKARQLNLPAVVITFEPQPREYFRPEVSPPRLTKLREKLHALEKFGIDRMLCLRFNDYLASLTAEQFVQVILVDGLGVNYLVVGDDFRFGQGRAGDFDFLRQSGERHHFEVANTHSFKVDNLRVSSTRIRQALTAGNLELVEILLGRPYCMCGHVAHGDKRGRDFGFPTANIYLHRHASPIKGVYAVRMLGLPEGPVDGVANVGNRPTVDGTRTLLEVHLLDFQRDIYGAHVDVCFLAKLRDEQRFDSFEALRAQINRDVHNAREFFADDA